MINTIIANWKMNKNNEDSLNSAKEIILGTKKINNYNIILCPSFTALDSLSKILKNSSISLGAQNMHHEISGAFTGSISANMLTNIGVSHVIIGHNECRKSFINECNLVNRKLRLALVSNIKPILCLGEEEEGLSHSKTFEIISKQLERDLYKVEEDSLYSIIVAYEPVWAIGSNKKIDFKKIQIIHQYIRKKLTSLYNDIIAQKVPIVYGGSVNLINAKFILEQEDVNGLLIGQLSLNSNKFLDILNINHI